MFEMSLNFARRCVPAGMFADRSVGEWPLDFKLLGSCLNGQSEGTWANKLTFFFAVRAFLVRTEGATEERLGREVHEVRQAMSSWGVFPEMASHVLPTGDPRALYLLTPVHRMIRGYMKHPA
jgi:hypothetical protein